MKNIKLLVYDFDGVLTDNRVYVSETGVETVACSRSDGWWMGEIRKLGIEQVILSTEKNPVVSARGKKLGIPVLQGQHNKGESLLALIKEKAVQPLEVAYVGNDMNDWGCFEIAGLTLAPSDSHPKILAAAKRVIPEKGGYGVVRHIYDWLVTER